MKKKTTLKTITITVADTQIEYRIEKLVSYWIDSTFKVDMLDGDRDRDSIDSSS